MRSSKKAEYQVIRLETLTWEAEARTVLESCGLRLAVRRWDTLPPDAKDANRMIACVAELRGAARALERGFTGDPRFVVHAELFDDLASAARALLADDHARAAAVYGRIILEQWLRDEMDRAQLTVTPRMKAAAMNDQLKGAQRYSQPVWRKIQAHLDVGNAAAHGDEVERGHVEELLEFVESRCT